MVKCSLLIALSGDTHKNGCDCNAVAVAIPRGGSGPGAQREGLHLLTTESMSFRVICFPSIIL